MNAHRNWAPSLVLLSLILAGCGTKADDDPNPTIADGASVVCGEATCTVDQVCCFTGQTLDEATWSCGEPGSCSAGQASCDGPEDCSADACCIIEGFGEETVQHCVDGCTGGMIACHELDDCEANHVECMSAEDMAAMQMYTLYPSCW